MKKVIFILIVILLTGSCRNKSEDLRLSSYAYSIKLCGENAEYPPYFKIDFIRDMMLGQTLATDTIDGPIFKEVFKEVFSFKNTSHERCLKHLKKDNTKLILIEKQQYIKVLKSCLSRKQDQESFNSLIDSLGFLNKPILNNTYKKLEIEKLKFDYNILFFDVLNKALDYVHFSTYKLNRAYLGFYVIQNHQDSYVDLGFKNGVDVRPESFVSAVLDSVWVNGKSISDFDYEFHFNEFDEFILDVKPISSEDFRVKGRIFYNSLISGKEEWGFDQCFTSAK